MAKRYRIAEAIKREGATEAVGHLAEFGKLSVRVGSRISIKD
jgi:hypothetical protein